MGPERCWVLTYWVLEVRRDRLEVRRGPWSGNGAGTGARCSPEVRQGLSLANRAGMGGMGAYLLIWGHYGVLRMLRRGGIDGLLGHWTWVGGSDVAH